MCVMGMNNFVLNIMLRVKLLACVSKAMEYLWGMTGSQFLPWCALYLQRVFWRSLFASVAWFQFRVTIINSVVGNRASMNNLWLTLSFGALIGYSKALKNA